MRWFFDHSILSRKKTRILKILDFYQKLARYGIFNACFFVKHFLLVHRKIIFSLSKPTMKIFNLLFVLSQVIDHYFTFLRLAQTKFANLC